MSSKAVHRYDRDARLVTTDDRVSPTRRVYELAEARQREKDRAQGIERLRDRIGLRGPAPKTLREKLMGTNGQPPQTFRERCMALRPDEPGGLDVIQELRKRAAKRERKRLRGG